MTPVPNGKGRIYDIQEFSVHDGPGIRTTVFLKGCPLRCPWCHSPESQSFDFQMSYSDVRCIGTEKCGACLSACPVDDALAIGPQQIVTPGQPPISRIQWSHSKCLDCTACTKTCFPGALSVCGKDYTLEEVLEKLKKSYDFFRDAGGGVTVSGGEPLSQLSFTRELLKAVKSAGIHTALDTTGFAKREAVEAVLPYVDLFLFDLKHMDNGRHKSVVGVPNDIIHENARYIASAGGKFQIRIPVIPGFNNSLENMSATARFCRELGEAVELVQLLPYHHFGASKYARIQMYDPMPADLKPPTDEEMQRHFELMKSFGLNAIIH